MSTKSKILLHMKKHMNEWVSGETLSSMFNVSRTAIWKNIRNLKSEGFVIESSPKLGHRLIRTSDLLLETEIKDGLKTSVLGQNKFIHYTETDSTNLKAWELAMRGAPEGTLVISENQTKGRGRRGRDWVSMPEKGISLSVILRPRIEPAEALKLTLITSVALAETIISCTGLDVRIKWPNDLLISGRKIAGILTEMHTDTDEIRHVVVGFGLNVNTRTEDFPVELREIATSLLIESGREFSRVALTRGFLELFENYYLMLTSNNVTPVIQKWKDMADIHGRRITVQMIREQVTGWIVDIDRDGFLIIKDDNGKMHTIISGDVIPVKNEGD